MRRFLAAPADPVPEKPPVRLPAFLQRRRTQRQRAAVAASGDALALAMIRRDAAGRATVLHCAEVPARLGFADPALRGLLKDCELGPARLSAVIGMSDYQMAQIAAPEVPPAELRAAARWRMREVMDFALDDATVDVFDVPPRRGERGRRTLFAVASRGDVPQFIAAQLAKSTSQLDVIDIPELCQRNLAALLPADQRGVALLLMRGEGAQLVLTRQGELYLARQLDFEHVRGIALEGAAPALDANDIALELQRSLDYYETHFDQPPITDLVIAPADGMDPSLASEVAALTGLKVQRLDLGQVLEFAPGAAPPAGWLGTLALGAALRQPEPGR